MTETTQREKYVSDVLKRGVHAVRIERLDREHDALRARMRGAEQAVQEARGAIGMIGVNQDAHWDAERALRAAKAHVASVEAAITENRRQYVRLKAGSEVRV